MKLLDSVDNVYHEVVEISGVIREKPEYAVHGYVPRKKPRCCATGIRPHIVFFNNTNGELSMIAVNHQ